MKTKNIIILTMILAILTTGCSGVGTTAHAQNNSSKMFNEADGVVSQGTIEAKEVSINSKIPGRILKINVEEGQEVKAGDILVEIASDELKAKKEQALAQLEAAKAGLEASKSEAEAAQAAHKAAQGQVAAANSTLQKAENGARTQEIAQAQAAYDLWQKTYERVQNLFEKGAVSAQKVDEVKTQLEVSKQQLSIAKEGARSEDKSGAQALVAQAMAMEQAASGKADQAQAGVKAAQEKVQMAEGAVQEVDAYLRDTKIVAPLDGVATVINSHEGELVSTGMSIATVSDIKNAWVEVKVKETDLEKIAVGKGVNIKIPSYSQKQFKGKVVRINQKPDFATKRSTNDNGDFDVLSFGVKIELDNKEGQLRPGMTAFVQFEK